MLIPLSFHPLPHAIRLLVLLASIVSSSLFDTASKLLQGGSSVAITTLADALPSQSTFFFSYVCNALLFVGLFDVLQIVQLLVHLGRSVWRLLCRCAADCAATCSGSGRRGAVATSRGTASTVGTAGGCTVHAAALAPPDAESPSAASAGGAAGDTAGGVTGGVTGGVAADSVSNGSVSNGSVSSRSVSSGSAVCTGVNPLKRAASGLSRIRSQGGASTVLEHQPPGAYSMQYVLDVYARLVLISSIVHVFMIVAPLSSAFGCLFFLASYPTYAHLLLHVLGRPTVDTGGEVWEEAIFYQTAGLLVSQALLFSVASLKLSPITAVLSLISFALTLIRTLQLRRSHIPASKAMSLQRCAELDTESARSTTWGEAPFSLRQYEAAASSERVTLFQSVEGLVEGALGHGLNATWRGASAVSDLVVRVPALAPAGASRTTRRDVDA